ncbi:hypothetical protein ACET3Z_025705 [Daucus carota]
MDHIWEVPEKGFVKINVHYISSDVPLPNGNSNAVGVIVRNDGGRDLWTALGHMEGLNEEQTLMAGVLASCVDGVKKEREKIHIETTNRDVYDTIRIQNQFGLQEDQVKVYRLFNTLYTNHFKEGSTVVCVSWIPTFMNSSAEYLASYGIQHLSCFVETNSRVGDLAFHMERDMGRVLPHPVLEPALNLGEGEARVYFVSPHARVNNFNSEWSAKVVDKEKQKYFEGRAFNNNGIFSPNAIRFMNDGLLGEYSDILKQEVVDFCAPVKIGLLAGDLLHHATEGTMHKIQPTRLELLDSLLLSGREFFSMDEVLHALGLSQKPISLPAKMKDVCCDLPSTSALPRGSDP